jgi:hypothetical protein
MKITAADTQSSSCNAQSTAENHGPADSQSPPPESQATAHSLSVADNGADILADKQAATPASGGAEVSARIGQAKFPAAGEEAQPSLHSLKVRMKQVKTVVKEITKERKSKSTASWATSRSA